MASFKFDDEDSDLDLTTGGDTAVAQPPARPQPPAPTRPAAPTARPSAAELLQRQRPPAQRRPQQPSRPDTQPSAPAQPAKSPTPAPVQQPPRQPQPAPAAFPPSQQVEPEVYSTQEPAPAQQPQVNLPATKVTLQPQQPVTTNPPAVTPAWEEREFDGYTPTPPVTRTTGREPDFMRPESATSVPRQPRVSTPEPATGNGQKVRERQNPLMAFIGPFIGRGSNQGANRGAAADTPAGGMRAKRQPSNDYAGGRQKVLLIRIGVFAIAGIVLLAGARALFFPNQGPTYDAVAGVAREATGYTGFPQSMGEGVALGFTQALLTYDPNAASAATSARENVLRHYVGENLFEQLDLGRVTQDNSTPKKQTVTAGPYIYGEKNIDETHAVVTTITQVNGNKWLYLSVSLLHNAGNNTVTVSAMPSFIPPVLPGDVADKEYKPTWDEDGTVQDILEPSLTNYLQAWAAGRDPNLIDQFLVSDTYVAADGTKGASRQAKRGLGNTVAFVSLDDLSVASAGKNADGSAATQNVRLAQFNVTWEDTSTQITYPQTYRLRIVYQNSRWLIQDIGDPLTIVQ